MNPKSILSILAAAAVLLLASTTARAQTSEDAIRFSQRMPLSGAVSLGTGGAGIAGLAQFTDLFQNPAGLGLLPSSVFSVGLSLESVRDESIFRAGADRGLESTDGAATRLGNLAYAYRFPTRQGALVFAAAYSQTGSFRREMAYSGDNPLNSYTDYLMPVAGEFDILEDDQGPYPEFYRTLSFIGYETFAIDFDADAYANGAAVPFLPAVSAGTIRQSGLVVEEGATSELGFGGAIEAAPGFLVGASIGIPIARYEYSRIHEEDDLQNDNDGSGGTTDFSYLRVIDGFKSDLVGVNARVGIAARVTPQVRFGLSFETPTVYSVDESYDVQLLTEFDNGDRFEYGDHFSEDAGRGDFEYELRTPWRIGIGGAFDAGALQVFADLLFTDWSRMEFDSDDYSFAEENLAIRDGLRSTTAFRLGGAYDMGNLTLRLGGGFDPDPREDTGVTDEVDRDRTHLSAGFSYRANRQFTFDFGWMHQRFDDRFNPYTEVQDHPVVDEEVARNHLQAAIRLHF
jgi:long-subunit fatty acid transport protein